MLPPIDRFAGAARRAGRGPCYGHRSSFWLRSPGLQSRRSGASLALGACDAAAPTPRRRVDAARLEGRRLRAAELVHRRPRPGRHLLLPARRHQRRQCEEARVRLELRSRVTRSAARKRRRSWSTASCTPPAPGATCTRVDAATGKELWRYDPKGDWFPARNPCCDLVNRGVAVWKGKVYVGVGRRASACDRRGHRQEDLGGRHHRRPQAPLLEHRRAADRRRRRGHRQRRRRHGARRRARLRLRLRPVERRLQMAVLHGAAGRRASRSRIRSSRPPRRPGMRTRDPQYKCGGTAWDGFAYDPALRLVYFGTANAAPYDLRQLGQFQARRALHRLDHRAACRHRPAGVALPDDAARSLGFRRRAEDDPRRPRHRRRATGTSSCRRTRTASSTCSTAGTATLLSAKNFTYVNWASGVDMKTGPPVTTPQADWYRLAQERLSRPGRARTPGIPCP